MVIGAWRFVQVINGLLIQSTKNGLHRLLQNFGFNQNCYARRYKKNIPETG
jgi:hypothetical protein